MKAFGLTAPRLLRVRTPEGFVLSFTVGSTPARLGAFLLDTLVISGVSAIVIVLAVVAESAGAGAVAAVAIVVSFLLRTLYFAACEVVWGGKTIGKRLLGLRVIARDGGPLTSGAAFARNLTREVELFLPLTVLIAPQAIFGKVSPWIGLVSGAWLLAFAALPFFGRERLRAGDILAGTLVVLLPRELLLPDLAGREAYFALFLPADGE